MGRYKRRSCRTIYKLPLYGALVAVIFSLALPLTALAEETPITEETLIVDETSIVGETSVEEETSVAEETSVVEDLPVAEEALIAAETPVTEDRPVITIVTDKNDKYRMDTTTSKTLSVGTKTKFIELYVEASASNGAVLTYKWEKYVSPSYVTIQESTSHNLSIPTTEPSSGIRYRVTVSTAEAEPKTTGYCSITTYALLFNTEANRETTVMEGYIDTFLHSAALLYSNSGSSSGMKYQWYKCTGLMDTDGGLITDATSATYTLPADLTVGTHYYYQVAYSTGLGGTTAAPITSEVATVIVVPEGTMPIPYPIPVGEKIENGEFVHWTIKSVQIVSYEPTRREEPVGTVGDEHYDYSYDIVLANDTLADSPVVIHWNKTGSAYPQIVQTVAVSNRTSEATMLDGVKINGVQKERGLNVYLVDGKLTAKLYVYYSNTVYATFTFNFTIAPPDMATDPLLEEVASIAITVPPKRTQYFDGGSFDRAGMIVTATLKSVEGSEPITSAINGYTVLPEKLSLTDTQITVTFGEGDFIFTATQPVTILANTEIGDVTIANGQAFGNIDYQRSLNFLKPYPFLDILTLWGEDAAEISFYVNDRVEVYIGDDMQAVDEVGLCQLSLPTSADYYGTATTVTLRGGGVEKNYTFTCWAQHRPGLPSRVVDYLCIGSQYTNGGGLGPYGLVPVATLRGSKAGSMNMTDALYGPKSLGNFGGYITWYYDAPITDDPNNPYGIDFVVLGNSFSGHTGYAEPGQVYVSEDGTDWYALAGAFHYDDNTDWNRTITYKSDGTVADSAGFTGYTNTKKHPNKALYPLFAWNEEAEREIMLSGVYLKPQSSVNEYGNTVPPYPHFGYADCGETYDDGEFNPYTGVRLASSGSYTQIYSDRNDGFDLKWAVDKNGEPVTFPNGIRYVKVQTATYIVNSSIGEKSTEVNYMRTAQSTKAQPVGVTARPASITVNGNPVDLSGVTTAGNTLTGNVISDVTVPADGAFLVSVAAPETANIYINSERGAEATLTTPKHGMLRIIVQEDEQEPWIAYLNLLETGESGEYSRIEFDPVGGTMEGTSRIYMPETSDKSLPVPVWNNRTFLGWYDASATGARVYYTEYNEAMPRNLTLTAGWEYNAVPDVLPPGATRNDFQVTFRLIGATKSKIMGEGEDRNDDIDLGNEYGYKDSEYVTWIATSPYTVNWGDTMYELFTKALNRAGLAYEGAEKNYVSSITAPKYYGGEPLAEMTNGQRSGWMYTVGQRADLSDQKHPDRGLLQYDLQPGDIVIWHYVNDYSYEVEDWFEEEDYPSLAKEQGTTRFFSKWLEAPDTNPPNDGTVAPGTGQDGGAEKPDDKPSSGGASLPDKVTELEVKAEIKDNIATVAVKADEVTAAVETAKKDGSTAVSVKVTGADNAKAAEVSLPKASVNELKTAGLTLVVDTPVAAIALDGATLTAIAETAKDGETIKIAAETVNTAEALNEKQQAKVGDNPVIEVNISVGTTAITNLGGTVTVSVPYTPPATVTETDQDLLTVYYLDDDGNITEMKGAHYDAATGKITFTTTHFSKFFVSEWINPFTDIAKGEWYYKAARYAYSNALMTGSTPTTFDPQATLTRAMLATILYRNAVGEAALGVPPSPETPFTDVASGQWYTPAIAWASSNGLITGTGDNKFAPNDPITREQFATLLYRYTQWSDSGNGTPRAASPTDANLSAYTDAGTISDWAREAMAWAVSIGLITGRTETTLAPEIPANRAEAAMLLQRYLENIA